MSSDSDNVTHLRPPTAGRSNGGNGGGSGVVNHRLSDLERRIGILENKLDEVKKMCIRIETKMDSLASKSYILWFTFSVVFSVLLSIFGHMMIRILSL